MKDLDRVSMSRTKRLIATAECETLEELTRNAYFKTLIGKSDLTNGMEKIKRLGRAIFDIAIEIKV